MNKKPFPFAPKSKRATFIPYGAHRWAARRKTAQEAACLTERQSRNENAASQEIGKLPKICNIHMAGHPTYFTNLCLFGLGHSPANVAYYFFALATFRPLTAKAFAII